MYFCADCTVQSCDRMALDEAPSTCPSKNEDYSSSKAEYLKEENWEFNRQCTLVSMSLDGRKPRLIEIIDFAKRMGYKKLGLAFCSSLAPEARVVAKVIRYHGLEIESVICKTGAISRDFIDITGTKWNNAMCNPIAQADLLNKAGTELNIVLGLCVGHDSLFFKYSKAPVTVLADKDRALAHNPLGAIYQANLYYKDVLFPPKEDT